MPPKRATVPTNTFRSAKALDKLTGRAPNPEEQTEQETPEEPSSDGVSATPQNRDTVLPQNRTTVSPQSGSAHAQQETTESEGMDDSSTREKITFYLRPDQVEKLDELVIAYRRHTGRRTNRNALMRQILDQVDIELFLRGG